MSKKMNKFATQVRIVHDYCLDPYDMVIRRTVALAAASDGLIHVGVAYCAPCDQFSRKVGRVKAIGRLNGAARNHYTVVNNFQELEALIGPSINNGVDDWKNPLEFCFGLVQRDFADLSKVETS